MIQFLIRFLLKTLLRTILDAPKKKKKKRTQTLKDSSIIRCSFGPLFSECPADTTIEHAVRPDKATSSSQKSKKQDPVHKSEVAIKSITRIEQSKNFWIWIFFSPISGDRSNHFGQLFEVALQSKIQLGPALSDALCVIRQNQAGFWRECEKGPFYERWVQP